MRSVRNITFPRLSYFAALVGLVGAPAIPQPVPQGPDFLVNQAELGSQLQPSTSYGRNGDYAMVWTGPAHPSDFRIYCRTYGADGRPTRDEFVISKSAYNQRFPDIAKAPDGSFVVVWQEEDLDGSGSGIVARRFDANGFAAGSDFIVNATTAGDQIQPSIAYYDLGENPEYVVVWQGPDGDGQGVFGQRFDEADLPVGSEFLANVSPNGEQRKPRVAGTKGSEPAFLVVWEWEGTTADGIDLMARRIAPGSASQNPFNVNTFRAGDQHSPDIDVDEYGNPVLVWVTERPDTGRRGTLLPPAVVYRRLNSNNMGASTVFVTPPNSEVEQTQPAVGVDADGNALIAWRQSDGGTAGGTVIRAVTVTRAGSKVEVDLPQTIDTGNSSRTPRVAVDRIARAVVVWSAAADQQALGIVAQQTDPTTPPFAAGPEVEVTDNLANGYAPHVIDSKEGRPVILWVEDDGHVGSPRVRARRFEGGALSAPLPAFSTSTVPLGVAPRGAQQPSGAFVSLWDTQGGGLRFNRRLPGENASTELNLETNTGAPSVPDVASDGDGNLMVVWQESLQKTSNYSVFARRYSPEGLPAGPLMPIAETEFGSSETNTLPTVRWAGGASFVVAWSVRDEDSNLSVAARIIRSDGTLSDTLNVAAGAINMDVTELVHRPEVVWDVGANRVLLVYSDAVSAGEMLITDTRTFGRWLDLTTESLSDVVFLMRGTVMGAVLDPQGRLFVVTEDPDPLDSVWGRQFDDSLDPSAPTFRINTYTANDQAAPSVGALGHTGYLVAWTSEGQVAPGSRTIHARAFDLPLFEDGFESGNLSGWTSGSR